MQRVIYLMSGPAHLPYLVVSLYHLRRYWTGAVRVYAWPESLPLVERIASDNRLEITCHARTPNYRGKNDQFFDKIDLMRDFFDGPNLYLDADTMPNGDLGKLFEKADQRGFCATQFCDWKSNEGQAKNRVKRLLDYDHIPHYLVRDSITDKHPSVNGGVFCCQPWSPVLKEWQDWTRPCKEKLFIADETVLHAVCRKYEGKHLEILSGHYNCSPKQKWWPKNTSLSDIKIIHFHGDSNVRPDKSQFGFDLWYPEYLECIEKNLGYIQEWKSLVNNRYLNEVEKRLNG